MINLIKCSICMAIVVLIGLQSEYAYCGKVDSDFTQKLTLSFYNESIDSACKKISDDTDFQITLHGKEELTGLKISGDLDTLAIVEGLKKLLNRQNHAIVIKEKEIDVFIFGQSQDGSNKIFLDRTTTPVSQEGCEERRVKDLENMPPLEMFRDTSEDYNRFEAVGPELIEIFPPDEPGGTGTTLAELKHMEKEREGLGQLPPEMREILPPDEIGGAGTTLAELQQMEKERESLQKTAPELRQILPPDEPGGTGTTITEIQQMKK